MGCSISKKKYNQNVCSKSILKTCSTSLYVDMPDSGRIPKIAINQTKIHRGMVFQNKLLYPETEYYVQSETKHFTTQQFIKSRYMRSEDPSPKSTRNISIVKMDSLEQRRLFKKFNVQSEITLTLYQEKLQLFCFLLIIFSEESYLQSRRQRSISGRVDEKGKKKKIKNHNG